jgi:uncharacterized protein
VSTADLIAVGLIVTLAAMVQITAGFGFSLSAVPLLALVIDTKTASMLAAILSLVTSLIQAYQGRAHTQWSILRNLLPASFLGMPFGLLLFSLASDRALRLFLGVSTLAMVLLLMRGVDLSKAGRRADWLAGSASGVLSTSLNTNGPPLVFLLQARGLNPDQFRATITSALSVMAIVSVIGRVAVGGFTTTVRSALVVAPVALAVGTWCGFQLRPYIAGDRFRRAVEILLLIAALSAIVAALI